MNALVIRARLEGGISLPGGPLALDALLMAAVALRDGLPPASVLDVVPELPIPIAKSGRVYLASFSLARGWDAHERRFVNRKFPLAEAQAMGAKKLTRITLSTGPQKSYRIPHEVAFAEGDELTWYAIGDEARVRDLLAHVTHLGKKRGVGRGRVRAWSVEPCEPWAEGFPVVRDGRALRALPADWAGLAPDATRAFAVLSPPYWENWRGEECVVPDAMI